MNSIKILNDGIIELSTDEIHTIIDIANQITISPSDFPEEYCNKLYGLSKMLPSRIIKKLKTFAVFGSSSGFLLIQKIPMEHFNIPPTPANNNLKIGETTILARIQSLFISAISEMIAYEAEGYGRLFQDIVPAQNMEKDQTSLSSGVELELHTEQAFSKLKPDIFSLSCLRSDSNAMTYILPVHLIVENMKKDELAMLYQPLWKMGVDLSFKINGKDFIDGDIRGPFSILQGSIEDPMFIFDQDLIIGTTVEAEKLVHKIVDLYYTYRKSHNLKPGEVIIIDNRRAVHGRSSFFPKYDGQDRFLTRCFAIFDYDSTIYARKDGGRIISSIYS